MSSDVNDSMRLPDDILGYYNLGEEAGRLSRGMGLLELARTKELIERFFPPAPAVILDVGGGPGTYASWLARSGYEVHLIDAVPLHVEQAREVSLNQPSHQIASLQVGDARTLNFPEESFDGLLLFGPLYHLIDRDDRLAALREARRVLRPGGILLTVAITRFASTLVGLYRGWQEDPEFLNMIEGELVDGRHLPPPDRPRLFTTAFFHRPDELASELADAGLIYQETLAVEGPGWIALQLEERWLDESQRETLLSITRSLENERTILGMSPHILSVARK